MAYVLRSFKIGIINLLGVTVPGLILIFLITIGFIAPVILFLQNITTKKMVVFKFDIPSIPPIGGVHPAIAIITVLVLAYTIGYIFRLSTPDKLDSISAERVIENMGGVEEAKKDCWPYLGDEKNGDNASNNKENKNCEQNKNKFPYFYFYEYLEHRNHRELLEYVKWNKKCRSKTFVNKMKIETYIRSPYLSSIIESNEAHIRLLFGIWLASRLCFPLVCIGVVISLVGVIQCIFTWNEIQRAQQLLFPFSVWIVITLILAIGSFLSIKRIEQLFHYRRVRELFDIVVCTHYARKIVDKQNKGFNIEERVLGSGHSIVL